MYPVHPHVRGEDESILRGGTLKDGSPPRAWGRLQGPMQREPGHRFTPTCVGKTARSRKSLSATPVHPHVRGEDARVGTHGWAADGSPPRAWGRPNLGFVIGTGARFTPTCVGKTPGGRHGTWGCPVHPHVRGEDESAAVQASHSAGSPPRAWGRLRVANPPCGGLRFTPTCVGKTYPPVCITVRPPVHPHVRGEDVSEHYWRLIAAGSPPRAWGRPRLGRRPVGPYRFTPTCAGKTPGLEGFPRLRAGSPPRAWGRPVADEERPAGHRFTPTCVGKTQEKKPGGSAFSVHPHVRGEDSIRPLPAGVTDGSPPRAWGRRVPREPRDPCERFTPTCVGKTAWTPPAPCGPPVHPHVRGEDLHRLVRSGPTIGSPPRAWGRPQQPVPRQYSSRFTPTCVGKTLRI